MELDYDLIYKLFHDEGSGPTESGRILGMSHTGYKSMMEKKSMDVKTLIRLVTHFKKPFNFFFNEQNLLNEPASPYNTKKCNNQDCRLEKESMNAEIKRLKDKNDQLTEVVLNLSRKGECSLGEIKGGVETAGKAG